MALPNPFPSVRPYHNPIVQYVIVGAILLILGLIVMVRYQGPAYPQCREQAHDSLRAYEDCVRTVQASE